MPVPVTRSTQHPQLLLITDLNNEVNPYSQLRLHSQTVHIQRGHLTPTTNYEPKQRLYPRATNQATEEPGRTTDYLQTFLAHLSLYKIVLYFTALAWESIMGVHHPCIAPPHLQSLRYCKTIARLLRNIRPPSDPPCVCHVPYNIGNNNIV